MRHVVAPFLACLLFALPCMAEPRNYGHVGEWDISYYPASGGCQIYQSFDGRTGFFIGFDTNQGRRNLDITLLDTRWRSIAVNKPYRLQVRFGSFSPWVVDMDGVSMQGEPGLNVILDASGENARRFVAEFRRATRMNWRYGETTLGHFSLRGSRRAFDQLLACQRKNAPKLVPEGQ